MSCSVVGGEWADTNGTDETFFFVEWVRRRNHRVNLFWRVIWKDQFQRTNNLTWIVESKEMDNLV